MLEHTSTSELDISKSRTALSWSAVVSGSKWALAHLTEREGSADTVHSILLRFYCYIHEGALCTQIFSILRLYSRIAKCLRLVP